MKKLLLHFFDTIVIAKNTNIKLSLYTTNPIYSQSQATHIHKSPPSRFPNQIPKQQSQICNSQLSHPRANISNAYNWRRLWLYTFRMVKLTTGHVQQHTYTSILWKSQWVFRLTQSIRKIQRRPRLVYIYRYIIRDFRRKRFTNRIAYWIMFNPNISLANERFSGLHYISLASG